jgi:hypothetical protein
MALISIRARSTLATIDVLAPERYDPRRALDSGVTKTVLLGDVANLVRRVVQPSAYLGRCLVLDTSDAREGIVISRKVPLDGSELGSAKKVIEPRDVIISRLRPYLRQVAFVDAAMPNSRGSLLVCSTEFFVLRSPNEHSIAFLVPFLLSRPVQEVLAAAQEGGHHPRFDDSTLLTLPVPVSLLDTRDVASRTIEKAVEYYRQYERGVEDMIADAEKAFT